MIKPEVSKSIDFISLMYNCAGLSIQKGTRSEEVNFLLLFKNSIKVSFIRSIPRIMLPVD